MNYVYLNVDRADAFVRLCRARVVRRLNRRTDENKSETANA